jgi:predicted dehydrogenase
MLDAFRLAAQPLFVAYYRRAQPRFVTLKQLIDSGKLGRVVSVAYSLKRPLRSHNSAPYASATPMPWRVDAAQSGGGLFMDLGSHVVDLLHFLLGDTVQVTGVARNHSAQAEVEDTVVGMVSFASGAVGTLNFCFAASLYDDCLDIIGDQGRIRCSVFGTEPIELCNDEGTEQIATEHPHHVQAPLIASMVKELLGQPVRCPSTGQTALPASIAMDRMLAAYYGGRDDAFWQRSGTWPGLRAIQGRPI